MKLPFQRQLGQTQGGRIYHEGAIPRAAFEKAASLCLFICDEIFDRLLLNRNYYDLIAEV